MARNLQAHWLTYDIPEKSGIKNPSNFLRRRAFRPNKSVWVVCKADIPYSLIADMKADGASVYCIEFAAHENDNLIGLAIESVRRDIMQKLSETRTRIARAQRLERETAEDRELTEVERRELIDTYRARARAQIRSARKLMKDLEECCQHFGISPDQVSLADARSQVDAIQMTVTVKAKAVKKAAKALAEKVGEDDEIVRALLADMVPADIFADYSEDRDVDATELRKAFGM